MFRNNAGRPIRELQGTDSQVDTVFSVISRRIGSQQIVQEPRLMKRVVIQELLPGMILAKPVTNTNGLPIVAVGTTLDGFIIERLHRLELASVYVEGDAEDRGGKTLTEMEAELEHRFRRVTHDPIQQMILRVLRTHLHATHSTMLVPEKPATE